MRWVCLACFILMGVPAVQAEPADSLSLNSQILNSFPPSSLPLEFSPVGATRGLDVKVATSVLVDRNGLLWVASREGLYRFDGYQATALKVGDGGLPDNDIRALYEDRAGNIWIASNTSGLTRYQPAEDRFTHFRHQSANPDSLSHESIYGMAEDADGQLWAGSQIGLNRLDPVTGQVTRFRHDPAKPRSLSHNYVYDVLAEPAGDAIWVATIGGGVNRWRSGASGFDHFDLSRLTAAEGELNSVFALARHGRDLLFAGTRAGLVALDIQRGEARVIDLGGDLPPVVPTLEWGPDGRLWIGTMARGVLVYDPVSGTVAAANPKPLGEESQLPALPQLSLQFSGGRLFVGTWGSGVYMARLRREGYGWVRAGAEPGQLRHHNVTAVVAGRGLLPWMGSFGGGLQPLLSGQRAGTGPGQADDEIFKDGILTILQRRDGQLLAGSNHGLWVIEQDDSHRLISGDSPEGLGTGYVTSLLETEGGDLWVGVGGSGLFRLPAGSDRFQRYAHTPGQGHSLSGNYITTLLQLQDNLLLVGTRSSGLNLCTMAAWQCQPFGREQGLGHHNVTALYRDRAGDIWAGTDGGGLHQLQLDTAGRLQLQRRWTAEDGLLGASVMGIVEDDDGSLWISSRQGLSRLRPQDGLLVHHVAETGLPVTHFNARAVARDDHHLYFGGIGGLVTMPAGTEMMPRQASPVRMVDVSRRADSGDDNGIYTRPATSLERIDIGWGEMLSVSFAVLDFASAPHQYQYRLRPTEAWQSLGPRRELTLLELSPGEHLLKVRGRDVFGSWNESPALLLNVVPPFWMTGWFRAVAGAIILLSGFSLHHFRLRGLRRRNRTLESLRRERERALEKAEVSGRELAQAHTGLRNLTARLQSAKEEQRQQIARELHDELGQTLTAAKLSLQRVGRATHPEERKARLGDSVSMLDKMIAQVRNISLTLRPPLLDEVGLVEALKVHLDSVSGRTQIDIVLLAEGEVGNVPEELRTAIFRLTQEAVNNALRHAGCRRILVNLRGDSAKLSLCVEDDGCGFDPDQVWQRVLRGEHLGLLGMLERARSAGGELHLDAEPGRGSRISAVIPLHGQTSESAADHTVPDFA
ncbi:two-component regulator propeller domain-containing protein [Microbulbifer sp. ALW1]|uniref:sensor histidine kinase n=1 Tax=Microbulbifer sp. (strain ALW1) TaxID=1516059 RepID=UPI00135B0F4C|nr:two-component regulator propeller domain-containing protein [Microbulbifer sp. ALW1]